MKIVSIVGARPQFIKLAPFSKIIRKRHEEIIIHTGQHYDSNMSGNFFSDLEIPNPDFNLEVGSDIQGKQTGEILIRVEKVLFKEKPDLVVVFGDTNSTLAGALVASKLHIPVVHIEAGLRSFNKSMPEEINRVLTDHCSDLLFTPTKTAMNNLKNEGLLGKGYLTGDIMLDSLKQNREKAISKSRILELLSIKSDEYYLLTLHRPYNVDNEKDLLNIFSILAKIDKKIIFPLHPRTQKMLKSFSIKIPEKIQIIDPVGYLDFIMLQSNSIKVITDSGGIQKEAYMLGKPCITVRPETEWVETVESGWNILVGFNTEKMYDAIVNFNAPAKHPDLFGEYSCAEKMVTIIDQYFGNF